MEDLDGYLEHSAVQAVDALAGVQPAKLDPAVLSAMIETLTTLLVQAERAHRKRVS